MPQQVVGPQGERSTDQALDFPKCKMSPSSPPQPLLELGFPQPPALSSPYPTPFTGMHFASIPPAIAPTLVNSHSNCCHQGLQIVKGGPGVAQTVQMHGIQYNMYRVLLKCIELCLFVQIGDRVKKAVIRPLDHKSCKSLLLSSIFSRGLFVLHCSGPIYTPSGTPLH